MGDFGFALGIMTVFWSMGSIQFAEIFPQAASHADKAWMFAGQSFRLMDLACALLFVGAMGKSAQFFLHTWLPDAMEGPTPVSALIHAATMVTAGVYMVCLLSPMFEYAPVAKHIVVVIGGITALFAATVGLMQNDIKRVIAYSTLSQLGYMTAALGASAYTAAIFHLMTHAFFKALLFLAAGSVIIAMHHDQDIRNMGGLRKYMPFTWITSLVGSLALIGTPFLSGFYSKDSIIHAGYMAGHAGDPLGYFVYVNGVFVAGLTAFYSWRLAFFTFNGHARWTSTDLEQHWHNRDHGHDDAHAEPDAGHAAHDDHGHGHGPALPHESPWTMRLPLLLLAFGAIFAGFFFVRKFIGEEQHEFWRGAIFTAASNHVLAEGEAPWYLAQAPLIVSVGGLAFAFWVYITKEGIAARWAANKGPVYLFLYNKWFFDELYDATFVRLAKLLGDLFWKGGDQKIIDGLGPDGVAAVSMQVGKSAGKLQTGFLYHYAFVMLLGVAGLLTYALWAWNV